MYRVPVPAELGGGASCLDEVALLIAPMIPPPPSSTAGLRPETFVLQLQLSCVFVCLYCVFVCVFVCLCEFWCVFVCVCVRE